MEFNQINLTTHDHVDRRIVYAILGSVAVLLAIFTLYNAVSGVQALRARSDYRAKIKDLQQQAESLAKLDEKGVAFDAEAAAALRKRSQHVNYLIALDVFPWITVMDALERAIPPQVVLDRFIPTQDLKTIRISGRTPSVEPISQFQAALEKTDLLQSVAIENMDLGSESSMTNADGGNGAMQFEIVCGLNLKAVFPEDRYGGLWMTLAALSSGSGR